MSIDNLTFGELKKISAMFSGADKQSAVEVGQAYLFRTVTHIEVGRVEKICGDFVTLSTASWIADTGRYHDCLVNGTFSEVEPYPISSTINMNSMINFAPWNHKLPTDQK